MKHSIFLSLLFHFLYNVSFGQIDSNKLFFSQRGHWKVPINKYKCVYIPTKDTGMELTSHISTSLTFVTTKRSDIISVCSGYVKWHLKVGRFYSISIRNGNYDIIYSGLAKVCVKKGDYVDKGQYLGVIRGHRNHEMELEFDLYFMEKEMSEIEKWFANVLIPCKFRFLTK